MFHTAVFLQDAPEWSIYDRVDDLGLEGQPGHRESQVLLFATLPKKTVPHPAHYSDIHEIFKLPRRTADICKVLSINKALEYALPCAQYVKGSAELYENAAQLYEAAVKVELR